MSHSRACKTRLAEDCMPSLTVPDVCNRCSYPRHIHRDVCLRARHRRRGDHHFDAAISCRANLDIGVDLTNSLW